jgi:hypothetical protein
MLVSDSGSDVEVTLGFTANVFLGDLIGEDTDTALADGTAVLTLFPTDPPFTHVKLQSLQMYVAQLEYSYSFVMGIVQVQVTLDDLVFDSLSPAVSALGGNGEVYSSDLPMRVTGTAHIVSAALQIDSYMQVDVSIRAPLEAVITEDAGEVIMDGIVIPPFHGDFDATELPEGVNSLSVDVNAGAPNVVLRGPYAPAILGDGDADGDFDLADFAGLSNCFADSDVPVDVFCTLFDLNGDADVDLGDYIDFATVFDGAQ